MPSLATRNLLHDRLRFAVTLTGIVFSVVLSAIQLGLFFGFRQATSDVIRYSGADLWITSTGVTHLESPVPFDEQTRYRVLAVPGVARADWHIVSFGGWRRPDGAREGILLIGTDLHGPLGKPWSIVEGSSADLAQPDAVIVDELYRDKLGVTHLGQIVEIRQRRARVVGFTRGIRTFTTSPTVFTSYRNAQRYAALPSGKTTYLLVQATPGTDLEALAARIDAHVPHVNARPTPAWRAQQEAYWLFGTGAGITVLIAAGLGLLVGIVVVAQTIYAATVEHIREYGTLKAMGASNAYLYGVIFRQAGASAVIGYAIGIGIALAASHASQTGTTAIILPWSVVVGFFAATLGMCLLASLVSINKVTRLDPALVFKA